MADYAGDFSDVELPQPVSVQASLDAEVRVVAGPSDRKSAAAIAEWLNDVKDIEEGVTGSKSAREARRDRRRARHMSKIAVGLAQTQSKLTPATPRELAQKICADEVRAGFVGLLGGGLIAIFFKALIGWAICRWLDWYFGPVNTQQLRNESS